MHGGPCDPPCPSATKTNLDTPENTRSASLQMTFATSLLNNTPGVTNAGYLAANTDLFNSLQTRPKNSVQKQNAIELRTQNNQSGGQPGPHSAQEGSP